MTVDTGGPVRGFLARWLMRVQAVQGTLQLVGIAVTAASTLTSALVSIGMEQYAPYVLVGGAGFAPAYAYMYVEWGLFNRKNREGADRGNNFGTPRDKIDNGTNAAGIFAAMHGREPTDEELAVIESSIDKLWQEYRNGVPLEETDE